MKEFEIQVFNLETERQHPSSKESAVLTLFLHQTLGKAAQVKLRMHVNSWLVRDTGTQSFEQAYLWGH